MKQVSEVEQEILRRCREAAIDMVGIEAWTQVDDEQKEAFDFAFLLGIRMTQVWVSERLFGPLGE